VQLQFEQFDVVSPAYVTSAFAELHRVRDKYLLDVFVEVLRRMNLMESSLRIHLPGNAHPEHVLDVMPLIVSIPVVKGILAQ